MQYIYNQDDFLNERIKLHKLRSIFELDSFFPYRQFIYKRFNKDDAEEMTELINSDQFSAEEALNKISLVYDREVNKLSILKGGDLFSPDEWKEKFSKVWSNDRRKKFTNKKLFMKRFTKEYSKMNKSKLIKQITIDLEDFAEKH